MIWLLSAAFALPPVFSLPICNSLPLHVLWGVWATTRQWLDVVDHVAFAWKSVLSSGRASLLLDESADGFLVAVDLGSVSCWE